MTDGVRVERDGATALVTLDRPDRGNALDYDLLTRTLPATWRELDADDTVRSIVLTGAGSRSFCTGADLGDQRLRDTASGAAETFQVQVTARQNGVVKPVIAAVNGQCVGGALMFLSDSDLILAADSATFSNPGVSVGIVATLGPVGLVHRVDFGLLMRMTILGRHGTVGVDEARAGGLVDETVPAEQLVPRALELAGMINENSPAAVREALQSLWQARGRERDAALADASTRLEAFRRHPDAREGPAAWAEGRAPQWAPPGRGT